MTDAGVSGRHVQRDTASHKELIRLWIAFADRGFAGSFDDFIAADYVGHLGASRMDRAELERLERDFARSFPDMQHTIDELMAEGDRVAARLTSRGTHRGRVSAGDVTRR